MSNLIDASNVAEHGTSRRNFTAPLADIMIVFVVSGLTFFLEDLAFSREWIPFGTELRGVFAVLAGACAAVAVVFMRGGTLAELGFRQPDRWAIVPLQVAAILVAFIAAEALVPAFVSMFISLPEPDLSRYDAISGNLGAAIGMALLLPLTASIPEEIIYRGFLIGRLSNVFGVSMRGAVLTVLIQALIFGAIHFQWGVGGMLVTLMMGIVWGTAYLLCGRNLWVVIFAHSGGHILLVVQLYLAKSIII